MRYEEKPVDWIYEEVGWIPRQKKKFLALILKVELVEGGS